MLLQFLLILYNSNLGASSLEPDKTAFLTGFAAETSKIQQQMAIQMVVVAKDNKKMHKERKKITTKDCVESEYALL